MESYATANFAVNHPLAMERIDDLSVVLRFLKHVEKVDPPDDIVGVDTPCWRWISAANDGRKGYGRFWFRGKSVAAHRASYAIFVGDLDDGDTVDHRCYRTWCVCPSHIQTKSLIENSTSRRCDDPPY